MTLSYESAKELKLNKVRAYQRANPDKVKESRRKTHWNLKILTLSKYGTHCACCGENKPQFLAIDHINNNGAEERKGNKQKRCGTGLFYYWLKKNNWPEGYQVLCHNCNMAKAFYKVCPHYAEGGRVVTTS